MINIVVETERLSDNLTLDLYARVTKSINSGKYAIGHCYQKDNSKFWYTREVPGNWYDTIEEAMNNYPDRSSVFNPFEENK